MPFITPERRKLFNEGKLVAESGDLCYAEYRWMVERWRAAPRWTTAHHIFRQVMAMQDGAVHGDLATASLLAWQVFFQLHVMPYELKKREENGDI